MTDREPPALDDLDRNGVPLSAGNRKARRRVQAKQREVIKLARKAHERAVLESNDR